MNRIYAYLLVAGVFSLAACGHGATVPPTTVQQNHGGRAAALATASPQPYAQAVLALQPVQYFKLSESAGPTAIDSSSSAINGTYVGNVTYGVAGPLLDEPSTAISLPGGTAVEGVSLPKPALTAGSSFSVQTWVYPILGSDYMTVWGYGYSHRLLVSRNGNLLTQFSGNFFSNRRLTTGAWHQIVFAYNASTQTEMYYVDGALDVTAPLATSAATFSSTYYLGQYDQTASYKWHGYLAQHAFFTTALTAAQVSTLYTSAGYGGGAVPSGSPGPSPTPPGPSPTPSATASPSPAPSPGTYTDWPTFGFDLQRTSNNPSETTLNAGNVGKLHKVWSVNLGGVIDAQPIVGAGVSVASVKKNIVYAGSESGRFDALDADAGTVIWQKQLGTYANPNCTDLPSWGVTATPAMNKAANVIYVADGQDNVHALNMSTGAELSGWPVPVGTLSKEHIYSGLTYNAANGMLYVETAGYCDIVPYSGRAVAINTSTHSIVATFLPGGTANGGGTWGEGGAAIDPGTNDVFLATGNVLSTSAYYGEALVRLTSTLSMKAYNKPNVPAGDNDFSGSPMLYQSTGCSAEVNAKNKDGILYTWGRDSISSGPVQSLTISGPDSFTGVAAYSAKTGLLYIGNPSVAGSYTHGLLALRPQANCTLALAWQSAVGPGSQGDTDEQAVIANGVVYFTDGYGKAVFAFNATTGAALWNSGTTIANYVLAPPTLDGGHLYVGAYDDNLYAFGM